MELVKTGSSARAGTAAAMAAMARKFRLNARRDSTVDPLGFIILTVSKFGKRCLNSAPDITCLRRE
jgi:hypothetical protein